MIGLSIRRQILGIAIGLIVLMTVTSILSTVMARKVAHQLDELSSKYVEAYGHLARLNIRSLEQALALRRMAIAKMQSPPDDAAFAERQRAFQAMDVEIDREAAAARALVNAIIDDTTTASDNAGLARIDDRIDLAVKTLRHHLKEENDRLISLFGSRDFAEMRRGLMRVDDLRDEFNQTIDSIRNDMLSQVRADATVTMGDQQRAIQISAILTGLAAILGLLFSMFVSDGIIKPVRRLLAGTRAVEAGDLDGTVAITTRNEIGLLTKAFNNMVEQLRQKERMRETFGKYIDPRVIGLIDKPALTAVEGQRRTMTVLFCDMKGYTSLSEGMTPQGLVKIMNHYLSTMSGPIRDQRGIIDKYIGDAIMAYWGPPFVETDDQARLACLAAIDMVSCVAALRRELPELLGVRSVSADCDIRIGIATGEVLVGSIGSKFMMNYTVMGDTVNLASRLEGANKIFGSRTLIAEATMKAAGDTIIARELDRLTVAGQSTPQTVYEIMGRIGELSPEQQLLKTHYAEALAAYRQRDWSAARAALDAALAAVPGDGPSVELARRIAEFQISPPSDDWDGARRLDHK